MPKDLHLIVRQCILDAMFPLNRMPDEELNKLTHKIVKFYNLRQTSEEVYDALICLDHATHRNRWLSQRDLSEATAIPQQTISRHLNQSWLKDVCINGTEGIRLNRDAFADLVEKLEDEDYPTRSKQQRGGAVENKNHPDEYRRLRIANPAELQAYIGDLFKIDGSLSTQGESVKFLTEIVSFLRWAMDNGMKNPFQLDMFDPDLFPGAYQHDWVGTVADFRNQLVASLDAQKLIGVCLLLIWIAGRNEHPNDPANHAYLNEILRNVPKQSKEHLKTNLEFFQFTDFLKR